MKFKYFLLVLMVLFVISIGAVSAADLNETTLKSSNTQGTFDDLQVQINDASDNSVLDLNMDYAGHYGSRIQFNKNLTIDGHGHTLDCLKERGCSAFYSKTGVITLKNLRIINAHNDFNNRGGAIHIEGTAKYVLENCIFEGNWAGLYGGAIFNNATNPLTIIDCVFKSNTADSVDGGAIWSRCDVNIKNSTFDSNTADCRGGAISCGNNINVDNSIFKSNKVCYHAIFESFGGAIYAQKDVTVTGSTFEDNEAADFGGAICGGNVIVNSPVNSSLFKNNRALDDDGGAIYALDEVYLSNAIFTGNQVKKHGGAVYSNKKIKVNNCLFEANVVEDSFYYCYGGAIYSMDNVDVENSIFKSNRADLGGAIYTKYDVCVLNSTFEKNVVKECGGAIRAENIYINLNQDSSQSFNTFFKDNEATNFNGGALYSNGGAHIYNAVFSGNNACYLGGGVFSDGDVYAKHCLFERNRAEGSSINKCRGGAIYANNTDVVNSTFYKNYAADSGGAISVIYGANINIAQDISGEYSSFFIENTAADDDGGAIASDKAEKREIEINVINTVFKGNTAIVDGGAIFTPYNVFIRHCLFESNSANGSSSRRCFGGAIRAEDATIDYCLFYNNYAENYGGAVYAHNVELKNPCSFENNTAYKGAGGALYVNKFSKDVKYATFINNNAGEGATISDDGGAIYINSENWITFSNCVFVKNRCSDEGGAIYLDSGSSHLTLKNNVFIGNSAGDEGQSVFNKGYYDKINSNFWGGSNPSLTNDQLIEWKSTVFQSNVHHVDSSPLKLNLDVKVDYRCGHPIIEAEAGFYSNDGSPFYGELYDVNNLLIVSPGLELINHDSRLNGLYEEFLVENSGNYTVTAKFYGYNLSKDVEI